jgi:mannose-6-phosphate isomerase-like protein (cupin superfamily)
MPELVSLDDTMDEPHAELFAEPRPRCVRLRLAADERIPPHTHPGTDVVMHLVSGALELSLDEETFDLTPGDLVRWRGEREVSPRAREPSTAVVVFAPAADDTA